MDLVKALRLERTDSLALVGAGGKTSALFQIAREFIQLYTASLIVPSHTSVLVTATTHLAHSQLTLADHHHYVHSPTQIDDILANPAPGVLLFTGPDSSLDRTQGLNTACLARLKEWADELALPLLIEADGSRQRPLKAPAEHEPALPPFVKVVVVLAGVNALGQPLDQTRVHRPEIFSHLSGLALGEPVTIEALVSVLGHLQGGLKKIPPTARRVLMLNQVDSELQELAARQVAARMLPPYQAVMAASLEGGGRGKTRSVLWVREPSAGIVLAAGSSTRYGEPKQLLLVEGIPLVRRAAQAALDSGLSPVVVVLGANAGRVEPALEGLPVEIVTNPAWVEGQSTSVKAGLSVLPSQTGSAVFFLADQPWVNRELVEGLVDLHAATLASLAAPSVRGQRANPALFDKRVFPELMKLVGDVGGRALFADPERYPVAWLAWDDERLLDDIDTRQDYSRLSGSAR